ncbi:hypothetical protein [Erythrobacter sp.]|uniref:hypothetical protein n=1 Tax=Erythrobacter sp. TaxID=1042 RepID=UPI001425D1F3|nr:hypothetical protein [Erythrobacter sp.]QIQ87621.1 MAG: hypothetical protein G9473_13690 [Erythrobacter sp.]
MAEALAGSPELAGRYMAFRDAAHEALGPEIVAEVRRAVAGVHGMGEGARGSAPAAVISYARRMVFEHTAITDEEAAAVTAELGEPGLVALSVVAALADAECRAEAVGLPDLAS